MEAAWGDFRVDLDRTESYAQGVLGGTNDVVTLLGSSYGPTAYPRLAEPKENSRDKQQSQTANMLQGTTSKTAALYSGKSGETIIIEEGSCTLRSTLMFIDCRDCTIHVQARCAKISIQRCTNSTFLFNEKILTQVVELIHCDSISANFLVTIGTLQVDSCNDLDLTFHHHDNFGYAAFATNHVRDLYPTLDVEHCQFKIQIVDDQLINEPLMRLPNGFVTTEREHEEFEERRLRNLQRLAHHFDDILKSVESKHSQDQVK
eukprot:gene1545-4694_t